MASSNNATCTNVSTRISGSSTSTWSNSSSVNGTTNITNPFAGDPVIFHTPPYVSTTHNLAIRLGHSNNVTVMLDGTQAQQVEYVEGICIAAIVCFCFFTVWMLVIFLLKCCGHKRVGFFSGQRIRRPMPPTPPREEMSSLVSGALVLAADDETDEDKAARILAALNDSKATQTEAATASKGANADVPDKDETLNGAAAESMTPKEEPLIDAPPAQETQAEDTDQQQQFGTTEASNSMSTTPSPAMLDYREKVVEWQQKVKKAEGVQRRIRIVVIFCCLGVIVSAILMLVQGVDGLVNSVEDVQAGLGQTSSLATAGIDLIDQFFAGQDTAINATESMLSKLNTICPVVQEQLCANISTATDCNYTGVPNEEEIQEIVEYYSGIQDMVYNDLTDSKSDLQEIIDLTAQLEQQMENFNWAFYVSAIFASLLALLSIFIMIGVVLAWRHELHDSWFRWVRNLLVVPLFVLLVFLSLLFSCIFVVGSITASDVCYGSPDPFVLEILSQMQEDFNPIGYRFMTFYVSGCPANDVPLDVNGQVNELMGFLDLMQSFLTKLNNDPTLLAACGIPEDGLVLSLEDVTTLICFLSTMVLDIRDYLNCNNWNPLYATFAYDAVCYSATKGFVWISSTQFAIVFFSMLIVTLRVACFEIEDEEDFQKQRRWCARVCSCCFASPKEKEDNDDGLMKPLDSSATRNNNNNNNNEPPAQEPPSPNKDKGSVEI